MKETIANQFDRLTLGENQAPRRVRLIQWIYKNWFGIWLAALTISIIAGFYATDRYGDLEGSMVLYGPPVSIFTFGGIWIVRKYLFKPAGVNVDVEHPSGRIADRIEMSPDLWLDTEFIGGVPKTKQTSEGNPVYKARRWIPPHETGVMEITPDRYIEVEGPALRCVHNELAEVGEMETMRDRQLRDLHEKYEPAIRVVHDLILEANTIIEDISYQRAVVIAERLSGDLGGPGSLLTNLETRLQKNYQRQFAEHVPWKDSDDVEDNDGHDGDEPDVNEVADLSGEHGEHPEVAHNDD